MNHSKNDAEKSEYHFCSQKLLSKEVLNFKEAMNLLGISASMLYKLTHKRTISFYKPNGKLIYFKKEDLLSWMLSNKNPSNTEVHNNVISKLNQIKDERR